MGTRFVSSKESPVHSNFKDSIINSPIDGTLILNKKSKPVIRAIKTDLTNKIDEEGVMDMSADMSITPSSSILLVKSVFIALITGFDFLFNIRVPSIGELIIESLKLE